MYTPKVDMFVKFNRKSIDDRQIDTLIGLAKGITADGVININEAEFLLDWLIQSRQATDNPIILNLLDKVDKMLSDGVLDKEEAKELMHELTRFTGEPSARGEIAKPSSLPLDNPAPKVVLKGKLFLCTGTFVFGSRKDCERKIVSLGGVNAKSAHQSLDYLILGTYVTDSWIHEAYGRKIEKVLENKRKGFPTAIISEEHWLNTAGI